MTISMQSSRQDLFIDINVGRFIFKRNQVTLSPCLTFTSKTGVRLPKIGVEGLSCLSELGFLSIRETSRMFYSKLWKWCADFSILVCYLDLLPKWFSSAEFFFQVLMLGAFQGSFQPILPKKTCPIRALKIFGNATLVIDFKFVFMWKPSFYLRKYPVFTYFEILFFNV